MSSTDSAAAATAAAAAPAARPAAGTAAKSLTGTTLADHPGCFAYMMAHQNRAPSAAAAAATAKAETHPRGMMSGAPDEAVFLAWLARTMGMKRVLEVGTFLGATALAFAEGGGAASGAGSGNNTVEEVVALEFSDEFAAAAKETWAAAGPAVADKITLRMGKAADTMRTMLDDEKQAGTFDLIFIDADKANYDTYYELGLQLLREGGVVAIDNTLWHGKVLDETKRKDDDDTRAIHEINLKVQADDRVDISALSIADGVTLCTKKAAPKQ